MEMITVIYSGGQPELMTAKGHRIVRGQPVALPKAIAEALLQQNPEEFKRGAE